MEAGTHLHLQWVSNFLMPENKKSYQKLVAFTKLVCVLFWIILQKQKQQLQLLSQEGHLV